MSSESPANDDTGSAPLETPSAAPSEPEAESNEEPKAEASEPSVDKPVDRAIDKAIKKAIQKKIDRPAGKSPEEPSEPPVEKIAARPTKPASAAHPKPAAPTKPVAPAPVPAERAKEGTARRPRPAPAPEEAPEPPVENKRSGTARTKRPEPASGSGETKATGSGTGRRKRPAAADDEAAPANRPSPVVLALIGAALGVVIVGVLALVMKPAPQVQTVDAGALWKRLNAVQEGVAALDADKPVATEVERLRTELAQLRESPLEGDARATLDRLSRDLDAMRAKSQRPAKPATESATETATPEPGAAAPEGRREREAKLASIDEGLKEFAFVVESRLFGALQSIPRSLLILMAEEQQGRGLRDRLRRSVRSSQGAPRDLIEVALRPEWSGFLGAVGYENIESWAADYMGEFQNSEAWRYWKAEQLPRLVESKARARRFEEALSKVEAAWTAKDHAAALAALTPFRESRDIWGTALLGWVEQPETVQVWGALPLRPEELERPGPRPSEDAPAEGEAPQARGSGTGFFVAAGLILTNAHVVQTATTVSIQMEGKPAARGTVLAKDLLLDLALIEVSGLEGRPLGFCRESLAVGESVYLYGYGAMVTSGGLTNEQAVWTAGTLSKFQQEGAQKLIVFDATVNPGNSGGPLVDCGGNWIGVVVAKTRSIGEASIDGYGFAVHGEAAVRWVDEQLAGRRVSVTHAKAPDQPMRPSAIARRLPASVVRVVVGGE